MIPKAQKRRKRNEAPMGYARIQDLQTS